MDTCGGIFKMLMLRFLVRGYATKVVYKVCYYCRPDAYGGTLATHGETLHIAINSRLIILTHVYPSSHLYSNLYKSDMQWFRKHVHFFVGKLRL